LFFFFYQSEGALAVAFKTGKVLEIFIKCMSTKVDLTTAYITTGDQKQPLLISFQNPESEFMVLCQP